MVHAIGRPVREAATVKLDVGGGSRDVSAEPQRASQLVDDDGCVILQGFPIGAVDELTDAYRIEVGYLRELAASMIAAGAQVVLVLPPVPLGTTRELVAHLAERLPELRRMRGRKITDRAAIASAFIDLAADARAFLAGNTSPLAREAAPEITLFIADDGPP